MEFRIIYLPSFKAAISDVDKEMNFSDEGVLGKFDHYFSAISLEERDRFMPRDFLYYDSEKEGMIWMWALSEGISNGGYKVIDFDGGMYLTYAYKDGDEDENGRLYQEAMKYISESDHLDLDVRSNHYAMGHIITPPELAHVQGWSQMETFIPVKLKNE